MGYEAKKTEHAGAKHGNGAYWGPKRDAKKESKKIRRCNWKREIRQQHLQAEPAQSDRSPFVDAAIPASMIGVPRNTPQWLKQIRAAAKRKGRDKLTRREINREIKAVREKKLARRP